MKNWTQYQDYALTQADLEIEAYEKDLEERLFVCSRNYGLSTSCFDYNGVLRAS